MNAKDSDIQKAAFVASPDFGASYTAYLAYNSGYCDMPFIADKPGLTLGLNAVLTQEIDTLMLSGHLPKNKEHLKIAKSNVKCIIVLNDTMMESYWISAIKAAYSNISTVVLVSDDDGVLWRAQIDIVDGEVVIPSRKPASMPAYETYDLLGINSQDDSFGQLYGYLRRYTTPESDEAYLTSRALGDIYTSLHRSITPVAGCGLTKCAMMAFFAATEQYMVLTHSSDPCEYTPRQLETRIESHEWLEIWHTYLLEYAKECGEYNDDADIDGYNDIVLPIFDDESTLIDDLNSLKFYDLIAAIMLIINLELVSKRTTVQSTLLIGDYRVAVTDRFMNTRVIYTMLLLFDYADIVVHRQDVNKHSVYINPHHKEIDLRPMAKKLGGGGNRHSVSVINYSKETKSIMENQIMACLVEYLT